MRTKVADEGGRPVVTGAHALLVGGAGFVGGWTARAFLDAGWRVTVVDPSAAIASRLPGGCTTVARPAHADVLNDILSADPPQVAVGLGAFGSGGKGLLAAADRDPGSAIAVNAGGLATLLEAAAAAGVRRVLWTSSTVVYGRSADGGPAPARESLPADPDTAYGLSKHLAETTAAWFRAYRPVEPTGLRLPLVLGPGLHYRGAAAEFLDVMMAVVATGAVPARLTADFRSDVLYVKDAARLLVSLAEFPGDLAPVYNAPSFSLQLSQFVGQLAAETGKIITLPKVADADRGPNWRTLSDAQLRADTNFAPAFDAAAMISDWLEEAAEGTRKA